MSEEFQSLIKTLNVPLLGADQITELNRLQKQWTHWTNRARLHTAARAAEDREAAYRAFIENPTTEMEQRMLVMAEPNLLAARYARLAQACGELRQRASAQAAQLIKPVIDRVVASLRAEHDRRREAAEPVMSSKDRHPHVIEARQALDYAERLGNRIHSARSGTGHGDPLGLADALLEVDKLTQEVGQ